MLIFNKFYNIFLSYFDNNYYLYLVFTIMQVILLNTFN